MAPRYHTLENPVNMTPLPDVPPKAADPAGRPSGPTAGGGVTLAPRDTVRSAGAIGVATLASRVLGFVRDILIARLFGTSAAAQAFAVAFRLPNTLRDLVGEGAANAAFVPVLTERRQRDHGDFWALANALCALMAVVLAGIVLLGWWAAPWIVRVTAPGFLADPATYTLTVRLTRWLFPYLWLIGLTALTTSILNALRHFTVPAWGPCLLNAAMIAALLWVAPRAPEPIVALAIGVLVGGVLQLAVQWPLLARWGWQWRWPPRLTHPQLPRALRLLGPRALGSGVYQLNVLVDTVCASWSAIVGAGAVAALYYANRLFQFPLAIVGTALAQASLPTLSAQALETSPAMFTQTVAGLLRLTGWLAIPATVGLMVLGEPIVAVLFERGAFTAYSTAITAQALVWYALGLAAYMGVKILTNACYALQDTATPVRTAAVALVINIGLNLLLMRPMGVGGLALATTIASAGNFLLLWRHLTRRLGVLADAAFWISARRTLLAAAVMGVVCGVGRRAAQPWLTASSTAVQAAALLALLAAGAVTFLMMCRRLRVPELAHLPWISAK